MTWLMRLVKIAALGGALLTFGWLAAVVVAAGLLLFLLLASEPDLADFGELVPRPLG